MKKDLTLKPLTKVDEQALVVANVTNDYIQSPDGTIRKLKKTDNINITTTGEIEIIENTGKIWSLINARWTYMGNSYLSMNNQQIYKVKDPTRPEDAATKGYVDRIESQILSSLWIPGEIKMMPVSVTEMPKGWTLFINPSGTPRLFGFIPNSNDSYKTALIIQTASNVDPSKKSYLRLEEENGDIEAIALNNCSFWQYDPTKYAEIIAQGLTPYEYSMQEQEDTKRKEFNKNG